MVAGRKRPGGVSGASAIVWFREDLRLTDNPALAAAVQSGAKLVGLFVLDEESPGIRPRGGASRWWLHGSLEALAGSLGARGASLVLRRGPAAKVLPALV
nr:deoxyribodipyrimidine photo-lyase [Hyphomicrobiales bacterium]